MSKDPNLILNSTNIISWQEAFEKTIFPYGPFAMAIRSKPKIQYIQTLPSKTDVDNDGDLIYNGSWTATDPIRYVLDKEGNTLYQTAMKDKKAENKKELEQNNALMSHMFAHISPDSQITIKSHPEYQDAYVTIIC